MQKIFVFLLFVVISFPAFAQDNAFNVEDSLINKSFEAKLTGSVLNSAANLSEKCITKDWCKSEITLYNGEIVKNKSLKYNGFDDSFIWVEAPAYINIQLERDLIKEVKMKINSNNEYLIFRSIPVTDLVAGISRNVFLNVLIDGKISLYVYRKIEYYNNSSYKNNYKYFIKKQDGNLVVFKPNKLSLLAQLDEHKKEMRKILKKNKLAIKRESGLIKAIELLNLEI